MKPHRWMKIPVSPAGACKYEECGRTTVRARGLVPIHRPPPAGDANFQVCPRCDGIAPGPGLSG